MAVSAKIRVRKKRFPDQGSSLLVKRYVDLAMHCAGDARAEGLSSHPLARVSPRTPFVGVAQWMGSQLGFRLNHGGNEE